jgi:hypothetical protein
MSEGNGTGREGLRWFKVADVDELPEGRGLDEEVCDR